MQPTPQPIVNKSPYGIVGAHTLGGLTHLVNREVADGFEPVGAPFFVESEMVWCQALFKRPAVTRITAPLGRT